MNNDMNNGLVSENGIEQVENKLAETELGGLDCEMEKEMFTLFLIDEKDNEVKGTRVELPRKSIRLIGLVNVALTDDSELTELGIRLENFNVLKRIVEFAAHYENEEPCKCETPLPTNDLNDAILRDDDKTDEWAVNYINEVGEEGGNILFLYELLKASNKVECKPLVDVCTTKIASLIKGHSFVEVKKKLDPLNLCEDLETEKVTCKPSV